MPSVSRILQLAPVACYLSANNIAKRQLFGGSLDINNPTNIYCVYKILKKIYDNDPAYAGLQVRADYLFELCKKYAIAATAIVDGGGGGSISPITPPSSGTSEFPIYIIETDFSTSTEYNDTRIVGKNLIIFYNEINRYLIPGTEFAYTLTGVQILVPGFDATAQTVNMVIEQVTAGQAAGGGGSSLLGYYYYGTTDYYSDLIGGTDNVPYQGTFGATLGSPMDITFPPAAVDPGGVYLVVKIPDSQDIETVWNNTGSFGNNGIIPDGVWRSPVNNGNGYNYYLTSILYLFDGTNMTIRLSTS